MTRVSVDVVGLGAPDRRPPMVSLGVAGLRAWAQDVGVVPRWRNPRRWCRSGWSFPASWTVSEEATVKGLHWPVGIAHRQGEVIGPGIGGGIGVGGIGLGQYDHLGLAVAPTLSGIAGILDPDADGIRIGGIGDRGGPGQGDAAGTGGGGQGGRVVGARAGVPEQVAGAALGLVVELDPIRAPRRTSETRTSSMFPSKSVSAPIGLARSQCRGAVAWIGVGAGMVAPTPCR